MYLPISILSYSSRLLPYPIVYYTSYQVLEAAVIGTPDAMAGEKVVAVLVLRDDTVADASTLSSFSSSLSSSSSSKDIAREMREYLKDKLAAYKQPRQYIVLQGNASSSGIPRNHMGKVCNGLIHLFIFELINVVVCWLSAGE